MFCVYVKAHWPVQVGCVWYWWVVTKKLLVPGYASNYGKYRFLMSMFNMDVFGDSLKISYWNTLSPTLGKLMEDISPNWSDGGMSTIFRGWDIHWLHIRWHNLRQMADRGCLNSKVDCCLLIKVKNLTSISIKNILGCGNSFH